MNKLHQHQHQHKNEKKQKENQIYLQYVFALEIEIKKETIVFDYEEKLFFDKLSYQIVL